MISLSHKRYMEIGIRSNTRQQDKKCLVWNSCSFSHTLIRKGTPIPRRAQWWAHYLYMEGLSICPLFHQLRLKMIPLWKQCQQYWSIIWPSIRKLPLSPVLKKPSVFNCIDSESMLLKTVAIYTAVWMTTVCTASYPDVHCNVNVHLYGHPHSVCTSDQRSNPLRHLSMETAPGKVSPLQAYWSVMHMAMGLQTTVHICGQCHYIWEEITYGRTLH